MTVELPKCQCENSEEARFCSRCGNALQRPCGRCGRINPPASLFCNQCGIDLKGPREALSLAASHTFKHLADQILTSRSALGGEGKLVTVLFADVAHFTSIFEKLDPEEIHQIMDGTFQILLAGIHKYEGTISQFTGDGVMALFGAPLSQEDHAQRPSVRGWPSRESWESTARVFRRREGEDAMHPPINRRSGVVLANDITCKN